MVNGFTVRVDDEQAAALEVALDVPADRQPPLRDGNARVG